MGDFETGRKREFFSVPVLIQAHRVARTWVCTGAVGRVKPVDLGTGHFAKAQACSFYYYDLDLLSYSESRTGIIVTC
jgi:hypothetical protein